MKISIDQYCINVSNLEKSVHFYETVLGLEITHRVEIPNVSEVVLSGEDGNRIQLAWHHDHEGPIDHGNAFWVFDGYHSSITFYDFHTDHGLGGTDHSDGEIARYVEGEVQRRMEVPSHMALDRDTGLLYISDTGNSRIAVLDTAVGEVAAAIVPNYDGTQQ